MLPEESEHSGDCDALAAQLSQLAPTGAVAIQAKVFYEAGYRAGLERQRVTTTKRHLLLAAACLLVSVGAGIMASRLPLLQGPHNLVQAEPIVNQLQPGEGTSEDALLPPNETSAGNSTVRQHDLKPAKTDKLPPPFVAQVFAEYLTTWTQRNTAATGIKIGPIGSSWDDLVIAQTPPPRLQAAPRREDEPLLPEEARYRRFDLNPFRQVFRN